MARSAASRFHTRERRLWRLSRLCVLPAFLSLAAQSGAQTFDAFAKHVRAQTFENGWTFVVVERPSTAPVFAAVTRADIGSAQDPRGATGLAHMLEHLAFKGTEDVGTTDAAQEHAALDDMERAYQALRLAHRDPHADATMRAQLARAFEAKERQAESFVRVNAYGELIELHGGVGLNASTDADGTSYTVRMPANQLERFASLEAERFSRPVFRQFYKERRVIMQERGSRTDNQPARRLLERFLGAAFFAHPYRYPVIGYMSDIESLTLSDAEAFFARHYAPASLVTVVVGNIDGAEAMAIAKRTLGRVPARPRPDPVMTMEPPQLGEVLVTVREGSQPYYIEGYHKPSGTDPGEATYDAIADTLSRGRSSRLQVALVQSGLALSVTAGPAFPGSKYPNLFAFLVVPAPNVPNERIQAVLRAEIEKLTTLEVSNEQLAGFRTRTRAELARALTSHEGMARTLAAYQTLHGDWHELFRYLERIDQVTPADIRRVAGRTFVASNRTVAEIVSTKLEPTRPGTVGH